MKRFILVAALLGMFGSIEAAPAPLPKPVVPVESKHFYGKCFNWKYGACQGRFVFHSDGTFHNNLGTTEYTGSWYYKDGVIYTKETVVSNGMPGQYWSSYDYKVNVTVVGLKKGLSFGGTTVQTSTPVEFNK